MRPRVCGGGAALTSPPRVAAVLYACLAQRIQALYVANGEPQSFDLGPSAEFLARIDALRDELRDTMAVARGVVPELDAFSAGWGRRLLPAPILRSPPDVLVVIPHGFLHDLPLHLVEADSGELLGASTGFTFASSRALFRLCASRNPARTGRTRPKERRSGTTGREESYFGGGTDVIRGDPRFSEIAARLAAHFPEPRTIFDEQGWYTRSSVKAPTRGDARPDAVCIVAHGFIDASDHRLSGLLVDRDPGVGHRPIQFAGRALLFGDRPLRDPPASLRTASAAEVLTAAELEIDAQIETGVVLLLGCSAGAGRVLQADEPASLAETFLHIGASSVVAPLWDIDVQATSDWADTFAAAWREEGLPTSIAATTALRQLRDDGYGIERFGALTVRGDWV